MFSSYRDALPAGSLMALTHVTNDFARGRADEVAEEMTRNSQNKAQARPKNEIDDGAHCFARWR